MFSGEQSAAQQLLRVLNRTKGVVEDVVCYSPDLELMPAVLSKCQWMPR